MKSVLFIASVLALAHHAFAASCSAIQQYNSTLQPACNGTDVMILWPNYDDFTQYYRCQGAGNPVLVNCPPDTYFSYYLQICNSCADYIPAPACENLKTVNKPTCVKTSGGTTAAPGTTAKPVITAKPTTEKPTGSVTATGKPTTEKPTTPPTPPTGGVPAPPSPSTVNPDIPQPPTPTPTPPNIDVNPSSEAPIAGK